jgi:hypothetical protein
MKERESHNHPLFIKAKSIYALIDQIISNANDIDQNGIEAEITKEHIAYLKESALIVMAKLSSSLSEDVPYDLKMENATLIRKSAREILTNISGLELMKFREVDYLEFVRNEVEEFRPLFAEWVKTFDPWNYHIDRWGLFNPPGVNYDDHDPDDDIPFQNPLSDEDI